MAAQFALPDLAGKIIIVTGSNTGLGLECVRKFAEAGAHCIMACRTAVKAAAARERVLAGLARSPPPEITTMTLDLGNLVSVRTFSEAFQEKFDRLDILMNNAGVMTPGKHTLTEDGFELQFGTNHLGHFLLTGLLLPILKATPGSRVNCVASVAGHSDMKYGGRASIRWDDLAWKTSYNDMGAYKMSKLSNLLFARALHRKLQGTGVSVTAAHPGGTSTDLQRHSVVLRIGCAFAAMNVDQGALSQQWASVGEGVEPGSYWGPGGLLGMRGNPSVWQYPDNTTEEDQERLWTVSEELTGFKYEL